jgi:hypothetical protein
MPSPLPKSVVLLLQSPLKIDDIPSEHVRTFASNDGDHHMFLTVN